MKVILLISSFLLLLGEGYSQNFVLASNDPENDQSQMLSPDAKALYYAIDLTNDSLYLKMEFFSRVDDAEWSAKIALDTNKDVSNGGTWPGMNSSMKFDLLFDIYHYPGFPPPFTANILDSSSSYLSSDLHLRFEDTSNVVISISLSQVMPHVSFLNLIAGCGIVLGSVDDDIPDNTIVSIDFNSTGVQTQLEAQNFKIFPNPVENVLSFELPENHALIKSYSIYNTQGKLVDVGAIEIGSSIIKLNGIASGSYLLVLNGEKRSYSSKFTKQ